MTVATDRVEVVTEEAPKETLSYEQARDKLAAVVKKLEAGGLTLEQSLELWERGERLAAVCEEWLGGGRAPAGAGVGPGERLAAGCEEGLDGARARLATAMAQGAESGPEPAEPAAAAAAD